MWVQYVIFFVLCCSYEKYKKDTFMRIRTRLLLNLKQLIIKSHATAQTTCYYSHFNTALPIRVFSILPTIHNIFWGFLVQFYPKFDLIGSMPYILDPQRCTCSLQCDQQFLFFLQPIIQGISL